MSSGTIGAALAGALSVPIPGPSTWESSLHIDHMPSIAISYGVIDRPSPPRATELAHEAAVEICERLWNDWGYENGPGATRRKIQVYTVNLPLREVYLEKRNRKVCWTTMWRSNYGQLFKPTKLSVRLEICCRSTLTAPVNRPPLSPTTIGTRTTKLLMNQHQASQPLLKPPRLPPGQAPYQRTKGRRQPPRRVSLNRRDSTSPPRWHHCFTRRRRISQ